MYCENALTKEITQKLRTTFAVTEKLYDAPDYLETLCVKAMIKT